MESVTLIAPRAYDVELRERLAQAWNVREGIAGVVIEDGGTRVCVSPNDFAAEEMEPGALQRIVTTIRNPVFYTVDFTDIDLCKRVLVAVADDPLLLIDNDHGLLLPGVEFVHILKSQPGWDWRREAGPVP